MKATQTMSNEKLLAKGKAVTFEQDMYFSQVNLILTFDLAFHVNRLHVLYCLIIIMTKQSITCDKTLFVASIKII